MWVEYHFPFGPGTCDAPQTASPISSDSQVLQFRMPSTRTLSLSFAVTNMTITLLEYVREVFKPN